MWKILLIALAFQFPVPPGLDEEYARTQGGSDTWLVTVVVERADGTPYPHVQVSCEGPWFDHAEEDEETRAGYALWYKTDSRGAMIFLPHQEAMPVLICRSELGGWVSTSVSRGVVGQVLHMVIPE